MKASETKIPVVFSGGYDTDPRDGGRPVMLVAAGLGVTPELFRDAFSGVRPARGRGPTREEARRNKETLMKVLGPMGVTNGRLDEVSDYYRYRPEKGQMWPTSAAEAYAVVEDGNIKRIVITDGGSGYSSPPKATVKGFENVPLETKVEFAKDLKQNGTVVSVAVVPADRISRPLPPESSASTAGSEQ